jgi:hypothetical protein
MNPGTFELEKITKARVLVTPLCPRTHEFPTHIAYILVLKVKHQRRNMPSSYTHMLEHNVRKI